MGGLDERKSANYDCTEFERGAQRTRFERMSSREGAIIAGCGMAGSVMVEASGGG